MNDLALLNLFKPWLFYDSREREFACSIDGRVNVIYGRVAHEGPDRWVQFWFWYTRDWSPLPWRRGHEGDWEMVQYLMNDNLPTNTTTATYAQHDLGHSRGWHRIGWIESRPCIYVALGRHASYFTRGLHRHGIDVDFANGKTCIDPEVELMPATGWPVERRRWGYDKHSPREPGAHLQWNKPTTWAISLLPR